MKATKLLYFIIVLTVLGCQNTKSEKTEEKSSQTEYNPTSYVKITHPCKVVNSSFVLLSKFVACRQGSASTTATSHIRKTLVAMLTN